MNLNAFYDLRNRLHADAAAGTALLSEDFRLQRVLEAFGPLEGAAPVFRKLGDLVRTLLSPDCPDQPGTLLDALTLADAIACTQGAVSVAGTVEPLGLRRRGRAVTNAPYSVLSPLLDALGNSGGGRYSRVVETFRERPELLQDHRVKLALVKALGASYSELAQQAAAWLSQDDESILPLLEDGFDPAGKKEMVRRVQVMEAVAGAKANDFYLAQLPNAKKDVRAELIYALRHDPGNADKLLELCQTERGKNRDTAHYALASLESDDPSVDAYWESLAEKKPGSIAKYFIWSTTPKASELTAAAFNGWLDRCATGDEHLSDVDAQQLRELFYALPGKSGPAICDLYRRLIALGTSLDRRCVIRKDDDRPYALRIQLSLVWDPSQSWTCSEAIPLFLCNAIQYHPTPDLTALALELYKTHGVSYGAPALAVALLTLPAAEVYEIAKPLLHPTKSIFKKSEQRDCLIALQQNLRNIGIDDGRQILWFHRWNLLDGTQEMVKHPLREPLDRRFFEDLLEPYNSDYDQIVILLVFVNVVQDPELQAYVGEKLYQHANAPYYLEPLRRCGWTKCDGLLVRQCRKGLVSLSTLRHYFQLMPGDLAARKREADAVYQMAVEDKIHYVDVGNRNLSASARAVYTENIRRMIVEIFGEEPKLEGE